MSPAGTIHLPRPTLLTPGQSISANLGWPQKKERPGQRYVAPPRAALD